MSSRELPRPARALACALLLLLPAIAACYYPSFHEQRGATPPCAAQVERWLPVPQPTDPEVRNLDRVALLRLRGDGYQRGWQYGSALKDRWHFATSRMDAEARKLLTDEVKELEPIANGLVRAVSSHVVQQVTQGDEVLVRERMPEEYRAYIRGIADGAGLPVASVLRMVAYVMLSDASCSAFIAYGPATDDGRLLQLRSLDWGGGGLPAEQQTVLLVHEPKDGLRYLSPNIIGVVGSLSGVNEAGISLSEIGSDSADKTQRGLPMPILLEMVLARARTLNEAIALFRKAPGTGGYNYMIGSARERRGVVIEKTAHHTAVFEIAAGNYAGNPFFHGFAGFDCRADTAADPTVRRFQNCSRGKDGTPKGTNSYESRYRRQVELFESFGRVIDLAKAHRIASEVAAGNNLHSILYDFERRRVYMRNRAWFRDGHEPKNRTEEMRLAAGVQPPIVVDLDLAFPPRSAR